MTIFAWAWGVHRAMKENIQKKVKAYSPTILTGIVCLVVVLGILVFPTKKSSTQIDLSEYSSVNAICELATLKSFYHNVVVCEEEPSGTVKTVSTVLLWPFDRLAKTGYKQFWMEYSGIVETGIDASQIQFNTTADGVVEIFVPDATILSVYADENSLSEPLTEQGLFTTITGEEQAKAFAKAQSEMREKAENDQALLNRAKNNAKILLEQYVKKTGKEIGVNYTVKWISSPI